MQLLPWTPDWSHPLPLGKLQRTLAEWPTEEAWGSGPLPTAPLMKVVEAVHVQGVSVWAEPRSPGLCTPRRPWRAEGDPRTSKEGLELAHTVKGHQEQRLGRGLGRTGLRGLLCFPHPFSQAPLNLCSHGGLPWLGAGARVESLTPQGCDWEWSRGGYPTWPLPTDRETEARGKGQRAGQSLHPHGGPRSGYAQWGR